MGKFLKFQVRNAATATSATGSRDILINVDDIASVIDGAAGATVVVSFKRSCSGSCKFLGRLH